MPDREQPERRRATALRYEQGGRAPQVVATGAGLVADRILAAAREAGIPVRHDPALAEALATLELGADVPRGAVDGGGGDAGLGLPARRAGLRSAAADNRR